MRGARLASGPRWELGAPANAALFLLALPDLLPTGSILVLEECSMAREIREAIALRLTRPSLQVARQTLFPRSRQHHLPLTPEIARVLADAAEANPPAAPQLCDHVSAYLGSTVLLEWHDAFCDNPLLLSGDLEEAAVRTFAARVGAHVESISV